MTSFGRPASYRFKAMQSWQEIEGLCSHISQFAKPLFKGYLHAIYHAYRYPNEPDVSAMTDPELNAYLDVVAARPAVELLPSDLVEHDHSITLFLNEPQITAGELHEAWVGWRKAAGFKLGRKIDLVAKTHPQIKPWGDLPPADVRAEEAGLEALTEAYMFSNFVAVFADPDHKQYEDDIRIFCAQNTHPSAMAFLHLPVTNDLTLDCAWDDDRDCMIVTEDELIKIDTSSFAPEHEIRQKRRPN